MTESASKAVRASGLLGQLWERGFDQYVNV